MKAKTILDCSDQKKKVRFLNSFSNLIFKYQDELGCSYRDMLEFTKKKIEADLLFATKDGSINYNLEEKRNACKMK